MTILRPDPGRARYFRTSHDLRHRLARVSLIAAMHEGNNNLHCAALHGARVLVVDDDADTREVLTAVLELSGALVSTAESAAEAMRAFERDPPRLLISDIGLPDEDGFSLLRRVRALPASRGGTIPAIALTGYDEGT